MEIECPYNEVLQEDLEWIAACPIPFTQLKNSTILVTGATGLIGANLVRSLLCCNRRHQLNLHILAMVRSIQKAESIFGGLCRRAELSFIVQDITLPLTHQGKIDYILHTAAVTASKQMVTNPVQMLQIAINGTQCILELAREKSVQGFVYLSSMEVYGRTSPCLSEITEDMLGYLDLTQVRSGYPESKRLCECLCTAYATQYGLSVTIGRLAQTFGAGVLPTEQRVFAQFARSVVANEDIVLHTTGQSEGDYCYLRDAIYALLLLLVRGKAGQAYNITNEECHCTIGQMAQLVASEIANNQIAVRYEQREDNMGYAPDVKRKLSSAKLRALGWTPNVGLKEAYMRMLRSMEDENR